MSDRPEQSPAVSCRVLVIDDDPVIRGLLKEYLRRRGYRPDIAATGDEGLAAVQADPPDLILCDFQMPGLDGMEVVQRLKGDPATRFIPVLMLTAAGGIDTKIRALEAGVDGFLRKPPDLVELDAHLKNLRRIKSYTDELERADLVLFALARSIEGRDPYTGRHCERLSAYSVMLGRSLGLPEADLEALRRGGILHDLGKLAVPDAVLRKPGPLTPDEWRVMRMHPEVGEQICKPMRSLRRVCPIIRSHHERWDGNGYPDGLAGEAIPLLARIVQVADAYDALRTLRPYKPPLSKPQVFQTMRKEAEQGKWDVRILDTFLGLMAGDVPLEETYAQDYLAAGGIRAA